MSSRPQTVCSACCENLLDKGFVTNDTFSVNSCTTHGCRNVVDEVNEPSRACNKLGLETVEVNSCNVGRDFRFMGFTGKTALEGSLFECSTGGTINTLISQVGTSRAVITRRTCSNCCAALCSNNFLAGDDFNEDSCRVSNLLNTFLWFPLPYIHTYCFQDSCKSQDARECLDLSDHQARLGCFIALDFLSDAEGMLLSERFQCLEELEVRFLMQTTAPSQDFIQGPTIGLTQVPTVTSKDAEPDLATIISVSIAGSFILALIIYTIYMCFIKVKKDRRNTVLNEAIESENREGRKIKKRMYMSENEKKVGEDEENQDEEGLKEITDFSSYHGWSKFSGEKSTFIPSFI